MKKQTILITGCSYGGIGYAVAVYLRSIGHNVIASARKESDAQRLRDEGFETFQLDVSDSNALGWRQTYCNH